MPVSCPSGVQHLPRAVAIGAMVFHGRLSCHLPPIPLCLTKSGSGVSGVHRSQLLQLQRHTNKQKVVLWPTAIRLLFYSTACRRRTSSYTHFCLLVSSATSASKCSPFNNCRELAAVTGFPHLLRGVLALSALSAMRRARPACHCLPPRHDPPGTTTSRS